MIAYKRSQWPSLASLAGPVGVVFVVAVVVVVVVVRPSLVLVVAGCRRGRGRGGGGRQPALASLPLHPLGEVCCGCSVVEEVAGLDNSPIDGFGVGPVVLVIDRSQLVLGQGLFCPIETGTTQHHLDRSVELRQRELLVLP